MSRTNIEIDDELVAAAQRMYRLTSKRSAVDLALRRLVGEALGRDEALAMQGSGFDFTNDEVESLQIRRHGSQGRRSRDHSKPNHRPVTFPLFAHALPARQR